MGRGGGFTWWTKHRIFLAIRGRESSFSKNGFLSKLNYFKVQPASGHSAAFMTSPMNLTSITSGFTIQGFQTRNLNYCHSYTLFIHFCTFYSIAASFHLLKRNICMHKCMILLFQRWKFAEMKKKITKMYEKV